MKKTFPNVKIIAKMTRIPLLQKIFDILLFRGDDIVYLPKDSVIQLNQRVEIVTNTVLPSEVLKYFIEKANYHWIMDFCICRSSMHCEDYPIELGCLFLGKSILEINPNLGRKVTKEEAIAHIKKCQEAGLVHMIGKNRLDKQWLGVKDGDKLLSICNCCPCCCLWRISPILDPRIGQNVKKLSGVVVEVTDKCIGCGTCTEGICFVDAIKLVNNRAIISNECRGCGRCVEICPQQAITLSIEEENTIDKSIQKLDKIINVVD